MNAGSNSKGASGKATLPQSASERCSRCAAVFHCGVNDLAACACATLKLSDATLEALRHRYSGCLCLGCLAALGPMCATTDADRMSQIVVERRDGIAIVTLNRPEKRNALSPEMVVRLAAFWREVADDPAVRVIVVTGAGDQAFSSGGDLGSLIPLMMRTREPQGEWEECFAADRKQLGAALLRNASFFKPVIAAINGHAHAGGAEFVMSTDLRVMSSEATIGVTEVRRGLIASGGSLVRMARQVPWAHAMELLLLGEPIPAHQALAMGWSTGSCRPTR